MEKITKLLFIVSVLCMSIGNSKNNELIIEAFKDYKNVKVARIDGDNIILSHSTGIATFNQNELSSDELIALGLKEIDSELKQEKQENEAVQIFFKSGGRIVSGKVQQLTTEGIRAEIHTIWDGSYKEVKKHIPSQEVYYVNVPNTSTVTTGVKNDIWRNNPQTKQATTYHKEMRVRHMVTTVVKKEPDMDYVTIQAFIKCDTTKYLDGSYFNMVVKEDGKYEYITVMGANSNIVQFVEVDFDTALLTKDAE